MIQYPDKYIPYVYSQYYSERHQTELKIFTTYFNYHLSNFYECSKYLVEINKRIHQYQVEQFVEIMPTYYEKYFYWNYNSYIYEFNKYYSFTQQYEVKTIFTYFPTVLYYQCCETYVVSLDNQADNEEVQKDIYDRENLKKLQDNDTQNINLNEVLSIPAIYGQSEYNQVLDQNSQKILEQLSSNDNGQEENDNYFKSIIQQEAQQAINEKKLDQEKLLNYTQQSSQQSQQQSLQQLQQQPQQIVQNQNQQSQNDDIDNFINNLDQNNTQSVQVIENSQAIKQTQYEQAIQEINDLINVLVNQYQQKQEDVERKILDNFKLDSLKNVDEILKLKDQIISFLKDLIKQLGKQNQETEKMKFNQEQVVQQETQKPLIQLNEQKQVQIQESQINQQSPIQYQQTENIQGNEQQSLQNLEDVQKRKRKSLAFFNFKNISNQKK